jgi:hypothetical protein
MVACDTIQALLAINYRHCVAKSCTNLDSWTCLPGLLAAIGFAAQIVLLAARLALVDGFTKTLSAAGNHDLILMAAELENTGENAITAVANQHVIFAEVVSQAESVLSEVMSQANATRTLIAKSAGKQVPCVGADMLVAQQTAGQQQQPVFYRSGLGLLSCCAHSGRGHHVRNSTPTYCQLQSTCQPQAT